MRYKVLWSHTAENRLSDIFEYYHKKAGKKIANKISVDIINASNSLSNNQSIGQVENLLKGRQLEYRYLVVGNFKLIYTIQDSKKEIRISDVFDCRQNPEKMKLII